MVHEELVGLPVYNVPLCFSITGDVDAEALERAFAMVAARHPVLLATYDLDTDTAVVGAAPSPTLSRASGRPDDGSPPPQFADMWERPFELDVEPPVRIGLVSVAPDRHYFGMCVHHVAGDSWSVDLLLRDIGEAYRAARQGEASRWTEQAPSFFDHAEEERAQDLDTAWWVERLRDTESPRHPRTDPPAEADRGRSHRTELTLRATETQGIRRLARAASASPAAVFCTAVSLSVGRRGSVVGLPTVLRDTGPSQRTMGPLLNTLPVVTTWRDGLSPVDLVRRHAEAMASAIAHKNVPYSRILAARETSPTPVSAPLFLHVVNVDPDVPRLGLVGLRVTSVPVRPRWAVWPALWEFSWPSVGNVRGELFVSTDAFTPEQAQELADGFATSLAWLLAAQG